MKRIYSLGFITILLLSLFPACSSRYIDDALEKKIKNNVYLEDINIGGLKESEARHKIENYAKLVNVEPQDAELDENWEIARKERKGLKVNIDKTLELALKSGENSKLKLSVEEIAPKVTADALKKNIVKIASFSTPLLDKRPSRINNIRIASERINGKKIMPNEEFSMNKTLGRRTKDKGYENAPIIIKTEDGYKKGFGRGGGICQIASTLYNAVEISGMEITERHMHSKNVGYVPKGMDATISYGSVDFKFRNTRDYPVMIKTYLGNDEYTVSIFENRN